MAAVSEATKFGKPRWGDLSNFELEETLYRSPSVWKILGKFNDGNGKNNLAVIIVSMPSFNSNEQHVLDLIKSGKLHSPPTLEDEEYSVYSLVSEGILKFPLDLKVIYPATEFHIKKNRQKELVYLRESGQAYLDVTRNYLNERCKDLNKQLEWLYNILDGKAEQESIIYSDDDSMDGFVLLPNSNNWPSAMDDEPVVEDLFCLAIVRLNGIRTIRNLNGQHLTLLKNIKSKGTKAITEKYGVPAEKLCAYFHYLPSFFHLHVHFSHINASGDSNSCRNVLLDDVIDMLEEDSEACVRKSFTFAVSPDDRLYEQHRLYRNLPSPLKRLSKGIVNANDSLRLERSEKLKGQPVGAIESLNSPQPEGLKRLSALSGLASATDSLRLPRTDALKRVDKEYLMSKK